MGRSHGTRPVAILTDTPTFSSGCTTGDNSQGRGCQQLSEIVPFPCRFTSISAGGRLHQSVQCSSLLRYLQLDTTTYLLVRSIKPRKPCPAQPWIFSDFKQIIFFFNFGAVCRWFSLSGLGGLAYLFLKFCMGKGKEGKPRLWLTPCDQAPSAQDLSSHKPTPPGESTRFSQT